ncbi:hypothetical protein AgCh_002846 [Apium graveolens]
MEGTTIVFISSFLLSILLFSSAADTITANQTLRDGQTIVSARGEFELGFFSPKGNVVSVSLVNVLPACGVGKVWRREKEVHGYAVQSGLSENVFMGNDIVDMNAKCELMDEVSKVSERMKAKDVVSWNAILTTQLIKFLKIKLI